MSLGRARAVGGVPGGGSAPIGSVLFDIDGTLLDHDRASLASLRIALERESPGIGEGGLAAASDEWQRLEELHYGDYLRGEIVLEEQRRRRAAGMLAWLGRPALGVEGLEAWFAAFLDGYREHWALFDDVELILGLLEARGFGLGVITNADEVLQRGKLAALGIERRLPAFFSSSSIGAAKPAPAIFSFACDAIGLEPGRVAYVGDRLEADARGARDAGLLGIWLNRDPERAPVDDVPTIATLAELAELLPG